MNFAERTPYPCREEWNDPLGNVFSRVIGNDRIVDATTVVKERFLDFSPLLTENVLTENWAETRCFQCHRG